MKPNSVELEIISSFDHRALERAAEEHLQHHQLHYSFGYTEKDGSVKTLVGLYELLQVVFTDYDLFHFLMIGAASGFGVKLGGTIGKVVESAATELGKDLYMWLKKSFFIGLKRACDPLSVRFTKTGRLLVRLKGKLKFRHKFLPVVVLIHYHHIDLESGRSFESVEAQQKMEAELGRILGKILPFIEEILERVEFDLPQRNVIIESHVVPTRDEPLIVSTSNAFWLNVDRVGQLKVTGMSEKIVQQIEEIYRKAGADSLSL